MKPKLKTILSRSRDYSLRCLVMNIGILSSMLSMIIMTTCMVMITTDNTWNEVVKNTYRWIQENHWGAKASLIILN